MNPRSEFRSAGGSADLGEWGIRLADDPQAVRALGIQQRFVELDLVPPVRLESLTYAIPLRCYLIPF